MKKNFVHNSVILRLIVMAVIALALLMVITKPTEAQANGVNHIVQRGEYIALIARNYGTTVNAILAANPQITNPNRIYAGQVIFVPLGPLPPQPPPPPPPPPPPSTCRWHHYVTPGQTMLMISRMYGVDPFTIARANNIFNLNLIYWGTTLCIP